MPPMIRWAWLLCVNANVGTLCKNTSAYEKGAQRGKNQEKNGGKKSVDTVLLNMYIIWCTEQQNTAALPFKKAYAYLCPSRLEVLKIFWKTCAPSAVKTTAEV